MAFAGLTVVPRAAAYFASASSTVTGVVIRPVANSSMPGIARTSIDALRASTRSSRRFQG